MNTNASVFYGENQFSLCELPIPQVREDGILIQVNAAGICGSDLHIRALRSELPQPEGPESRPAHPAYPPAPSRGRSRDRGTYTGKNHIRTEKPPFPVVLGHEVTGTVAAIGSKANEAMYISGGPMLCVL